MGQLTKSSSRMFILVLVVGAMLAEPSPSFCSGNDENALFGKRWTLTEIKGRKFSAAEPYLEFDSDQKRASGSGGCNRFSGGFESDGANLKFKALASTRRACIDNEVQRTETTFLNLLQTTTRFEVEGNTLRLYAGNALVLVFQTSAKESDAAAPNVELSGSSWQLVKFQSSDDTTLTPDDKSKYTITFGADSRVSARVDCNRGSSTRKSAGPNQLEFGPMATTRAMCPPGSLHDRIVKDWSAVRSYVIKDGHLFLSLMADGGIYEYEPVGGSSKARVTGTVTYRQRIALPPQALVEVKLLDVSRADAPAVTIAEQAITTGGKQVPFPFELSYDPSRINERGRYVIRVRILQGTKLLFTNTDAYPVLTSGHPNSVAVVVKPAQK